MSTKINLSQCYLAIDHHFDSSSEGEQLFCYLSSLLSRLNVKWRVPLTLDRHDLENHLEQEWCFQLGWTIEVERMYQTLASHGISNVPRPKPPYTEEGVSEYVALYNALLSRQSFWTKIKSVSLRWTVLTADDELHFWQSQSWDSILLRFGMVKQLHEQTALIPKGNFIMGSAEAKRYKVRFSNDTGYEDERPKHHVRLTNPIAVMVHPMTQVLYQYLMKQNPSIFRSEAHPVENVSWFDAVQCANALSSICGYPPVYQIDGHSVQWDKSAVGWRLPTEAEWEYCALAGTDSVYSGGDVLKEVGWFKANSQSSTHPVGQKKPNAYGLHDMSGNVWEWCWDWHQEYPESPQIDPTGPSKGSQRVTRGGGWHNSNSAARCRMRGSEEPFFKHSYIGFRLVRTLPLNPM